MTPTASCSCIRRSSGGPLSSSCRISKPPLPGELTSSCCGENARTRHLWTESDRGRRQACPIQAACRGPRARSARRDPTGSHAKVLLADSGPDGIYEVVVGSCNWLSATYTALELSVRLRAPRLVREIAGILADMSRPASGAWGKDVTTLLRVADTCRLADSDELSGGALGARAMLVVDDEHYAAVRDVRNASARRVVVGCDLFGPAARTTVFEPLGAAARVDGTVVTILYNRPTEAFDEGLDDVVSEFASPLTSVSRCPGLHAKFLAWNSETLIVTSFNWLSASTMAGRFSVDELGVLVHDPVLVPKLVRRVLRMARVDEASHRSHDELPATGTNPCPTL